ncbi:UNVERIFIED_ORG: hypothetical protein ABIC62_002420 [Burkholderia sp. 1595]|uniref:Transposase n=1 Tax=Paraburkholderia terricola TaxID=169427 RepID=A0ABU1LSR2_9BURK|nr:hypothetical protein [Paraburkholderia terricola]MDR6409753.1 hypothetical protein [Paraburkholderia terricola]
MSGGRSWPTVTRAADWKSLLLRVYPSRAKSANLFFSNLLDRFRIAQISLNLANATPAVTATVHRQGVVVLIECSPTYPAFHRSASKV